LKLIREIKIFDNRNKYKNYFLNYDTNLLLEKISIFEIISISDYNKMTYNVLNFNLQNN